MAEDLEQYRQWQPHLHDLGEVEVKHGVRVAIVNLYTDELGNPKFREVQGRSPTIAEREAAPMPRRQRKIALVAALSHARRISIGA